MTTTFYPGPSQLWPQMQNYLLEAYECGILSENHRGKAFGELVAETKVLFAEKMNLPADYRLLFASSATETWQILTQAYLQTPALHIYNGAFGQKWLNYARELRPMTESLAFGIDEPMPVHSGSLIICLTHNETSNGTQVSVSRLELLRQSYPNALILVDAVSSMAGVELPWWLADVWFASVQKCFGMPAGLAVLVVSPRALEKAQKSPLHYNSLIFIAEQMEKNQTTHTPNVLGIFLLNRVLRQMPNIRVYHEQTLSRAAFLRQALAEKGYLTLCKNPDCLSPTVFCVQSSLERTESLAQKCRERGLVLGKGYGNLAQTTFRIANFPAIDFEALQTLVALL